MSDWIKMSDRKPEEGQAVIYYFDMVGRHRGHYTTWTEAGEFTYDVFHGPSGFLTDDVTHWMPDVGQEMPEKPE
jgi:hypothetical protein